MNNLLKRWTINCALGELIGIACAGGIAFLVTYAIGEPDRISTKLIVLIAMMFAGFVEGLVLSHFQWNVLVTKFPKIPKREWLFYTVLVGVLGWFLGMLPSLFLIPENLEDTGLNDGMDYSNPFVFALLSITMGIALGAIFGLFQWFSLKKYAEKAYKWIIANAIGWGLGLGWIYLFASIPTEQSSLLFNVIMGVFGGILAGSSVGIVTGIFLVKLKKKE